MRDTGDKRTFSIFTYRDASYRISPASEKSGSGGISVYSIITAQITEIREELELYIKRQPEFLKSFEPIRLLQDAPASAVMMAEAAELTGTGPMAAVAGTIAQLTAERTSEILSAGTSSPEIIIENGGDIFILPASSTSQANPLTAGIFSGLQSKFSNLALKIIPKQGGTAVCSSSSRMGHSASLGDCDLCTVISGNAAIADAAATLGCNLVKHESDMESAANRIKSIDGVDGVLIIKNEQIAIGGKLPEIVKHSDPGGLNKITKTFLQ